MSKTNFNKLTRWDADYYKSLTDDDCIVCLTEREIYLIGQIIEPLTWSSTRWLGDIVGLDFKAISAQLEFRLSERVTCQNITTLIQKLNQLEDKIDYIFNETVINEGDEGDIVNYNTPLDEHITPDEFAEDFSVSADTCDTAGKDAVYGGVYALVRYIHQNNIDALQQLAQSGNLAQQAEKLVSVFTGGTTPLDEIIDYTAFLMDELLQEYEATVDEALLQETTCDLFCIAVNSNCTINMFDVTNYFTGKFPASPLSIASSLADVVQFALTGTFSGTDYFYFMSSFQLIASALTDHFFSLNGYEQYKLNILAGMNSPDNDWTLFCDACPQMYRKKTYIFAYPQADVTLLQGTQGSSGLDGVDIGTSYAVEFTIPLQSSWKIEAVGWREFRAGGTTHGGLDVSVVRLRPTPDDNTGSHFFGGGFMPNGEISRCFTHGLNGANQLYFFGSVRDVDPSGGDEEYTLYELVLMYDVLLSPNDAVITEQTPSEFVSDCL